MLLVDERVHENMSLDEDVFVGVLEERVVLVDGGHDDGQVLDEIVEVVAEQGDHDIAILGALFLLLI